MAEEGKDALLTGAKKMKDGGDDDGGKKKRRKRGKRPGAPRSSKMKRERRDPEKKRTRPEKEDPEKKTKKPRKHRKNGATKEGSEASLKGEAGEGNKRKVEGADSKEDDAATKPHKKKKRQEGKEGTATSTEEVTADMEHRIFVSGLPLTTDEKALRRDFGEYGTLRSVKLILNTRLIFKGSAFISYKKEAGAAKALEMDGSEYGEKVISVKMAIPSTEAVLKVYVGGLPWDADEKTLRKDFGECGEITKFKMIMDSYKEKFKGVVFITYKDKAGVEASLKYDGTEYGGRNVVVRLADAKGRGEENVEDTGKGGGKGKGDKGIQKGNGKGDKGKGGSKGKGKGEGKST